MPNQAIVQRPETVRSFADIINECGIDYQSVARRHEYKFLWTRAANCFIGLWLLTNPHILNYYSRPLELSDSICGTVLIAIECLSFFASLTALRWCTPALGVWLLMAPLLFWSPTPAVFLSDTIAAVALISLSVLIPGLPGRAGIELSGPDLPARWTYNPSSWIRRWLGVALALLGFFISRYLAAYQLGYINHVFDPFFGTTEKVLHSVVSRSLPISDAGLGSVAYVLEAVSCFLGDRARWRTAPWLVVLFALLVLPLGVTSITLVIMQPVIVGAWCGLCLIAAVGLLTSVPLAVHEVIAMGQFLHVAKQQHKNFWNIFWMGGTLTGWDEQDPDRTRFTVWQRWVASIQGVTAPWTLLVQMCIGTWLMARPDVIASSTLSANCDHIFGALVITVAAIATAEVTRTARLANLFLGALLMIFALGFNLHAGSVFISEILCGLVLIPTSIPRGEIIESYAGWSNLIK